MIMKWKIQHLMTMIGKNGKNSLNNTIILLQKESDFSKFETSISIETRRLHRLYYSYLYKLLQEKVKFKLIHIYNLF